MGSPPRSEFAVASKRILTPEGLKDGCVLIRDDLIADITTRVGLPVGVAVEDVGDLVVMAGLVDTHVHINEPGRTAWEGFETATKAAAAGGITTVVDMPLNSSPVTTTVDAFKEKLNAARDKLRVDCAFYAGIIPGNTNDLRPLAEAGVFGFKAFLIHSGIDEFPNAGEEDLRAGMPIIAKNNIPLLVHCELQSPNSGPPSIPARPLDKSSNPRSYPAYLSSRPRRWEHDAIELMIRLCGEYNCRTHIVHLSSADSVPMLGAARQKGLPLTVETCPHYLYFSAEEIPDGDTRFKCAPPIRENENRERLWQALRDGVIDFVVSDHSPSTPELKVLSEGDFQKAWGGIASLQLGLSIVWTQARKRGFAAEDIARWMCERPAHLVGLSGRKGAIARGYDADLVVWDPDASFTVEQSMLHHRHKVTPYEGSNLFGRVEQTFLRGRRIYEAGKHTAGPIGKPILK